MSARGGQAGLPRERGPDKLYALLLECAKRGDPPPPTKEVEERLQISEYRAIAVLVRDGRIIHEQATGKRRRFGVRWARKTLWTAWGGGLNPWLSGRRRKPSLAMPQADLILAKRFFQQRGLPVYAASVIGGPPGLYVVGGEMMPDEELIDRWRERTS